LSDYCEKDNGVDILIIAFVTALSTKDGNIDLDLASQLWATAPTTPPQLPYPAPQTGEDIWTCQNNDKTVLLSFGGERHTSKVGFTSDPNAVLGTAKIWKIFGPPTDTKVVASSDRPFGNATVDGFDFNFKVDSKTFNDQHFAAFIQELNSLATAENLFSGAPQC
jgi:chitinase